MTTAAMNMSWPATLGNAAVTFVARWSWLGLKLVWRHPLHAAMSAIMIGGMSLGMSNALWMQTGRHPAPLFFETASVATPAIAHPVLPMPARPPSATYVPVAPVVPATAPTQPVGPIGNADVAELQQRLAALGFFDAKVDGYYGPKTADAIRGFEASVGLNSSGALTPEIIAAVRAYQPTSAPSATPIPARPSASTPQVDPQQAAAADPLLPLLMATTPTQPTQVATVTPSATVERTSAANKSAAGYDSQFIKRVQTGLSRLGFLHAEISGVFNGETARAIREFESYNNYRMTGELAPDLPDLLAGAGAYN